MFARCSDILKTNKKTISRDTILKFLANPMFYIQYLISSDLFFQKKIRISFKQKVFFFCPSIAGCTDPTKIPLDPASHLKSLLVN